MSYIEWDESYSVHNPEIDKQHKEWIAIYNNIHDVMIGTKSSSLNEITTNSLNEMYDYARKHFQFEENYMSQLNYPNLIEHRRIHRDFENLIYTYIREIKTGKTILNTSLIKVIRNWLVEHILTEDKKYTTFAQVDSSLDT
ncbi:MAG: bacteriohemerythrin [Proteobacteria bacterium]|nr:bacteriohemerythrin [Pseudomonadota bacterium]MBU1640196.1 bacteriohemerythrin [Pseudomonadota bacterium]